MQFIVKNLLRLAVLLIPTAAVAQSAYLPQGNKHQQFLQRLEIKLQRNADLNVFTPKPFSRKVAVRVSELADSVNAANSGFLSKVDAHNLNSLLMNNSEWVKGDKSSFVSRKPFLKFFYKTKPNFIEVDEKDFFLAVNPVIQQQQSFENDNDERVFLNSKGVDFRGLISRKIGFSGFITDNQERGPRFVQQWIDSNDAVPGAGFFKPFKTTATDYFDARGSIHFNIAKYVDMQFGYDRNFIGNGYRSLLISEFSSSQLFLKVNTRIWKLNYEILYQELTAQFPKSGDKLVTKKYGAMHHLSVNVAPWLNLGLFDAVIFGRADHFDFAYLNPIIFLRVAEQQNGSADNALVGLDFKANIAKRAQLYGQLMFDEFLLDELKEGNGWWGNKFGIQLGGKYIDLFGVKNLDIHGELNLIRPFTYTHDDSVANFTHYNQALAHPLGANLVEAIGIIRYQPHPKWTTSARLIWWRQGTDTANSNIGSDIFKLNTTRSKGNYGYSLPTGPLATGVNMQLLVSFELKENLFFDAAALIRKWKPELNSLEEQSTNMFTLAVRINMFRREYDY